jgi:hypothetical protein
MPLSFQASVDEKLSDRARNQVRQIVATAVGERGDVPRIDPFWLETTESGDVAIYAILDNAGPSAIGEVQVEAVLLSAAGDSEFGRASFALPAAEIDAPMEPGSAVFVVLTMGEDKIEDGDVSPEGIAVRLDLRYSEIPS